MQNSHIGISILAVLFFSAFCNAQSHPIVPGFERVYEEPYFEGEQDTVQRGLLLFGELGCASCHGLDGNQKRFVDTKSAPNLTDVGTRIRSGYFAEYLNNPSTLKTGTTMPHLLGDADEESVKAIASFLSSTGVVGELFPATAAVKNGKQLFESIGCLACHSPVEGKSNFKDSVPLGNLAKKYSIPSLSAFLKEPLKIRESGRMPHFGLNDNEAKNIASYLLKDIKVKSNLTFDYYEGGWDNLPDFSKLKPKSSGKSSSFDVYAGGNRRDNYGLVFKGFLKIGKTGKYRFHCGSDDGSRLLIDGEELIRVDGVHPFTSKTADKELKAGVYELQVEYFEKGGEEVLRVAIEGNGLSKSPLESFVYETREAAENPKKGAENFDATLVKIGREKFASIGCANCHSMRFENKPIQTSLKSKSVSDLTTGGCLDNPAESSKGANYNLNALQKDALVSAIKFLKDKNAQKELSESDQIHVTMTQMNCLACHNRDEFGGPSPERATLFKGDQPEMGDEGRLPPLLDGVGAKLKESYLHKVLQNGAKDRPYMKTRMPGFKAKGKALAQKLMATDKLAETKKVVTDVPERRLKVFGRKLAGEKGLSCIKCHTFANKKATGIQAISLTTMRDRLREDWFIEYMLEPSTFRPGTRMPSSWPSGQTFFKDMLDGEPRTQVYALWKFLSDGDKAATPLGLERSKAELVATDEPIIYRNFIQGAGSRAIGVGYPEKVNLAFDANQNRIALIWQGSFIDASKHWTGRGQGYQPPLGENVLTFADRSHLAVLETPQTDWPKQKAKEMGGKFKGYRFNKKREPSFMYEFSGTKILDRFEPVKEKEYSTFNRVLSFEGAVSGQSGDLYFLAATSKKSIEAIADGWYQIDGDWKMKVESDSTPLIRKKGSTFELIVPVKLSSGKTEIKQSFNW